MIFDFTQTMSLYKAVNSLSQWEKGGRELRHDYGCSWVMLTFQSTPVSLCRLSRLMRILFLPRGDGSFTFPEC